VPSASGEPAGNGYSGLVRPLATVDHGPFASLCCSVYVEKLLEQVLVQLAGDFVAAAKAEAQGEGDERILDFTRRIMDATVHSHALRSFVEREPQLALRLLIGQRGAIHDRIVQALTEVIAETHSHARAQALAHNVDVVVRVGAALQWSTLAIGEEPQTEDAVDILRVLLNAGH